MATGGWKTVWAVNQGEGKVGKARRAGGLRGESAQAALSPVPPCSACGGSTALPKASPD